LEIKTGGKSNVRNETAKPEPKVLSWQMYPNRKERRHGGLGLTLFIKAIKAGVATGNERNKPFHKALI
jgi:hypothetical protein